MDSVKTILRTVGPYQRLTMRLLIYQAALQLLILATLLWKL